MKRLTITAAALILALSTANAQEDDTTSTKNETVEIEISGNKVTIEAKDIQHLSEVDLNTIIRDVTERSRKIQQQQRELLDRVSEQLENGDISEEQAEDMREMINERTEESMEVIGDLMEAWGEQYEAKMEAWEEEYEASMEDWEQKMQKRAASEDGMNVPPLPPMPPFPMPPVPEGENEDGPKMIIRENEIVITNDRDDSKPLTIKFGDCDEDDEEDNERTESYFDINLGFNQQLKNGQDFVYNSPDELKFWASNEFNLGRGWKTRIGQPSSKFYIKYGVEFSFHDFRLQGNNLLVKSDSMVMIREDTTRIMENSKYKIAYFNIPFMLQFDFSEEGDRDEAFSLGIGGYGGVRLGSKRKLEYSDAFHKNVEEMQKDDFFTNQFRYGVMAQVGFGAFKITGKYDLNTFFKENRGPDYQMASITVGFTL